MAQVGPGLASFQKFSVSYDRTFLVSDIPESPFGDERTPMDHGQSHIKDLRFCFVRVPVGVRIDKAESLSVHVCEFRQLRKSIPTSQMLKSTFFSIKNNFGSNEVQFEIAAMIFKPFDGSTLVRKGWEALIQSSKSAYRNFFQKTWQTKTSARVKKVLFHFKRIQFNFIWDGHRPPNGIF